MKNPYYNSEGYADPTAYVGMKETIKTEKEVDKRVDTLIFVLKFIITACGFELIERIQLKDAKSGREFK